MCSGFTTVFALVRAFRAGTVTSRVETMQKVVDYVKSRIVTSENLDALYLI